MAKRTRAHYAFTAGETGPQYERRADWEFWIASAESLRNMRLLNGGGVKRRPGIADVTGLSGRGRFVPFTAVGGAKKLAILEPAGYRVMNTDETFETVVAGGQPWATGDLDTLQADSENNEITVTSNAFYPWVLSRSTLGAWSSGVLVFDVRGNLAKAQPYYRFPLTRGVSLTPGAVSGSGVALLASASLFAAGHVGTRFRIYDREVEIASVTNGTTATCDVKQTLYPTLDITVASSVGFAVGDQVSTSADELNGEVVAVPSGTVVRVNRTDGYTYPTVTSNNLVGPTAKSAISGVAVASAPAGTVQWDEQMISSVRGYPSGTSYHRARRNLYGFPQAPDVLCSSAQDETDDFDLGTASDDDAIQVSLGDAIGRTIRHAVSAEQLILLSDAGPYYVGEGPGTPFTPTTVDLLDIGPEPASDCNPIKSSEGVVYADRDVSRLMVLAPTGNVRRSWETGDLSDLAPHLLKGIKRLCLIDGCEWGPERYIAGINAAGHLSVMHYRRGEQVLGWAPWDTAGEFIDICVFNNKVYVIVLIGGAYRLQRFDEDRLLDDSRLAAGTSTLTNAYWASRTIEIVWRGTVDGEERRASLGYIAADGSGVLTGLEAEARSYEVGRPMPIAVKLWPPIDPNRPLKAALRVSSAIIDVVASGLFHVNDNEITPYDYGDDLEELPPLRTRYVRKALLGLSRDASITITQPWAAPLQIRMLVVEAS